MTRQNMSYCLCESVTLISFCLSCAELRSRGCDLGEISAVLENHLEVHQRHTLGNSEDLTKFCARDKNEFSRLLLLLLEFDNFLEIGGMFNRLQQLWKQSCSHISRPKAQFQACHDRIKDILMHTKQNREEIGL